jgi:hypothetical protein
MSSNFKASNTIDHNASFIATYAHAMANSPGTSGFIPHGQFSEKFTQMDVFFPESLESNEKQKRSVVQKPPGVQQRSNSNHISHFILRQSLKESL